jgi:hypothetical protein
MHIQGLYKILHSPSISVGVGKMLTKSQQMLLVEMLNNPLTSDEQKLFNTIVFYKSMQYLVDNSFVKKHEYHKDKRRFVYMLSLKGEIMAMMLAGLSDFDDDEKKYKIK